MRLKRGLERESCDFCHRRKIKCDRSARIAQGEATCSHCDVRQIPCKVDDSNDIRIRRRRQAGGTRDISTPRSSQAADAADHNASPSRSALQSAQEQSPQHTSFAGTPSFPLPDSLFDLSADSILFLDQIFMGDQISPEWTNTPLSFAPSLHQPMPETLSPDDQNRDLGLGCNMDSTAFNAALRCYFSHAALCLPILLQDAFWQDYEANRCCHALIYAVACRGIPFTEIPDKINIQKHLANKFKDSFFENQSTSGRMRLDDIEALALMANFQYERNAESSIPAHMESLFLSHDSLVMMTLQYRLEPDDVSAESLSRAHERRTLLFWHVYGLDAFNNLDHKKLSRIPDADVDTTGLLLPGEAHGYLDAILALAIIARTTLHKLHTSSTRRNGIKLVDLEALYSQLDSWRANCPQYLQHTDKSASKTDHRVQLQRCVLRLLQVNCRMQIESFMDEYGPCTESTLDGKIACLKVDYESLRAVKDALEVCDWMAHYDEERHGEYYALADLAPGTVRDICAGLCTWMSLRGTKLIRDGNFSSSYGVGTKRSGESAGMGDARIQMLREYVATAEVFRRTVARAVSHRDTETTVARVDAFLKPFADSVAEAQVWRTR